MIEALIVGSAAGLVVGAVGLILAWRWARTVVEELRAAITDLLIESHRLREQQRRMAHLLERASQTEVAAPEAETSQPPAPVDQEPPAT
jgi:hypothetical protein